VFFITENSLFFYHVQALLSQSVASSSSREPTRDLDFEAGQLEQGLLAVEEDADGEPDDELEEILPLSQNARKEEEEEEEEEEGIVVAPAPAPPRPPPKTKSGRSSKPNPARRESNAATKSKPPNKTKGKAKREAPVSDFEEEDLEFGQPARKTKRARPHPAPPPSEGLSLPGSSSTFHPSAAPYSSSLPLSNKASAYVPPPSHPIVTASDSEEDWEPVPAHNILDPFAKNDDGDLEEGEEIDVSEFEAEMNEELGDSDDFLAAAVSPEPESAQASTPLTGRPMSLNQFARGGGDASQDDDDDSTSEESDDD
jgi:hypothetical protein